MKILGEIAAEKSYHTRNKFIIFPFKPESKISYLHGLTNILDLSAPVIKNLLEQNINFQDWKKMRLFLVENQKHAGKKHAHTCTHTQTPTHWTPGRSATSMARQYSIRGAANTKRCLRGSDPLSRWGGAR